MTTEHDLRRAMAEPPSCIEGAEGWLFWLEKRYPDAPRHWLTPRIERALNILGLACCAFWALYFCWLMAGAILR